MESKTEPKPAPKSEPKPEPEMEVITIKRKKFTEMEQIAYNIAKKHLGSSFNIQKSNGFYSNN